MDPILCRRLASLTYGDPETLVNAIQPNIQILLQNPALAKEIKPQDRKVCLEKYQAAFLAFIMQQSMKSVAKISVAFHETDDFDCVLRAQIHNGETIYKPVQLKQLPSHELNRSADVQTQIDKLQKYASSPALVVALWINRDIKLNLSTLNFSNLTIEQLWFFGDTPNGEIMLHGATIPDLISGICWAARMNHGQIHKELFRFKPTQTPSKPELTS